MPDVVAVDVRRAVAGDAVALSLVGSATFLDTFAGVIDGGDIVAHCAKQHSPAAYDAWLATSDAAIWVAEATSGGAPVGYAVLTRPDLPIDLQPDDLELKRIYVLSRYHGAGVGPKLMNAAVDEARRRGARRVLLGVYSGNARALAFYAKTGFVRIGARQFTVGAHTYSDHILALPMIGGATVFGAHLS
jgi:ribosomal protein S18 acetylase RimI-like enzyme